MRVFIGIATGSEQKVKSMKATFELTKRPGDDAFLPDQFGPGLQSRCALEAAFHARPEYDALLMLDADQVHPKDMLEKLRESMETGLDMVCAHYYRRSIRPVESLCYELGDGTFPFLPMLHPPREGLHEIAVTGFGCVLIHRRVLEAVRQTLPDGASPFDVGALPGETNDYGSFGQDFRFFLMARKLGFKLWLRADVESLHGVDVWLGHTLAENLLDYDHWADKAQTTLEQERLRVHGVNPEAFRQRKRILEARKEGVLQQVAQAKERAADRKPESLQALAEISVALYQLDGKLMEVQAWIEWAEKYPKIERPDQLPTTENTPAELMSNFERKDDRTELYRREAMEMVEQMPNAASD